MNKKVLVLMGSPRKNGNCDILCDQFIKGARESNNEVEKINVYEKKINFCSGCAVCRTSSKCVNEDDMNEILDKMMSADVIVMSSPVYFYSINAKMKALIDRVFARYQDVKEKEYYYILTSGTKDISKLQTSIDCFRGYTKCVSGVEKGIIYGIGTTNKGDVKVTKAMEEAYKIGKNI